VSAPLLEFEQVTLRRGGRILFEGLDLRLGAGEAVHLTGPNGAGKSSLSSPPPSLVQKRSARHSGSSVSSASASLASASRPLRTLPRSARRRPAASRIRLDLPDPFGPVR
jgi:ABC-type molybdenum transport system ATPase subunit/photorepair protein PhrA